MLFDKLFYQLITHNNNSKKLFCVEKFVFILELGDNKKLDTVLIILIASGETTFTYNWDHKVWVCEKVKGDVVAKTEHVRCDRLEQIAAAFPLYSRPQLLYFSLSCVSISLVLISSCLFPRQVTWNPTSHHFSTMKLHRYNFYLVHLNLLWSLLMKNFMTKVHGQRITWRLAH